MCVRLAVLTLGLCLVGCQRGATSDDSSSTDGPYAGMVLIPGGTFYMGGDDGEMGGNSTSHQTAYPIHETYVDAFWMDKTEVTNQQFNEFVEATGYVTFAEKPLPEETLKELQMMAEMNLRDLNRQAERAIGKEKEAILDSIKRIEEASQETEYAGAIVFTLPEDRVYGMNDITQWWRLVSGATWRAPEGPGSTWKGREDHPVVNVTYEDAAAYAEWAGKRLPTEAEWERAARGGLDRQPYAWGSEFAPLGDDTWMANIWQGRWPYENLGTDGYTGSSPVKSFPPNPYGLYDIAGNVWEIVSDYYHPYAYSMKEAGAINPQGPSLDMITQPGQRVTVRISRGGSFLCSDVWCKGYQPGSRQPFDNESPSNHTGFRCVKDVVEDKNSE